MKWLISSAFGAASLLTSPVAQADTMNAIDSNSKVVCGTYETITIPAADWTITSRHDCEIVFEDNPELHKGGQAIGGSLSSLPAVLPENIVNTMPTVDGPAP